MMSLEQKRFFIKQKFENNKGLQQDKRIKNIKMAWVKYYIWH